MSAWLVDTNLIMRSADSNSAQHQTASQCLCELAARHEMVFVSNQTFFETWVVATRQIGGGGLGWSEARTQAVLDSIHQRFLNLADPKGIVKEWRRIVETHHIVSYKAHDMRFVAYARLHRIPRIMTFNTDDFKAVTSEIQAVNPADYLANPDSF